MSRKTQNKGKSKPSKTFKTPRNLKSDLRDFFSKDPEASFSFQQIIKGMGLRDAKSKKILKDLIFSLESKGQVKKDRNNQWVSTMVQELYQGRIDHVNPKYAYVIVDDLEDDVWVKAEDMKFAVNGDIVEIQLTRSGSKDYRAEGKVERIVKRNKIEFVGRIEVSEKFSFVVPDSRNVHFDVMVFPEKTMKAKHNDKVIVHIDTWHDAKNKSPKGTVTDILGQAGEHEAEIHSIMAEFGLPFKFPQRLEDAAAKISEEITADEIKSRRDMRSITTFTIDPADAKDFDDALSLERLDNGRLEIGVHIADVSHYVQPDTILEEEARDRATSVYLVDRTIPMLPEKLSNGLCSLRPNEDKLTFSAVFEMDEEGKVFKKWFGKTVIHSDRRFSYEDAQERIESTTGDFADEIVLLNEIAMKLRSQRFKKGAVNFETVEVKFVLDEKGKPLEVVPKERKEAHKMIEEFMLMANREVATFIFENKEARSTKEPATFVYRVHEDPDPEKLQNFAAFAARFGHKMNTTDNVAHSLNELMEKIEGKPEQNVLESIAIRSMAKARYTTDPKGHFGLAFEHYSHFTSPIRRYPDVMVHRLLSHYLQKGKSPDPAGYEQDCMHSSEREKRAADAERASIKYKQVEFMATMIGESFDGIVSGVTEWGIFVEIIATKCEGMVRVADLDDDFYEFDEKNFRVVGKRNKKIITLGDKLHVQVVRTDIERRNIDLILSDAETESNQTAT
ncbi:MAG: ribonuclease R [Cyclobacteriaceae bacterium]|jgi:ribonuclease R